MLKTGIYTIYDKAAKAVAPHACYLHKHEATAVRMFEDIATGDTNVQKHLTDYALLRIGYLIDDEQGNLSLETSLLMIVDGEDLTATGKANNG